MKKMLIIASALAAVMTTSAFAQTTSDPVRHPARKPAHVINGSYVAVPQYADPYVVIQNDRVVGRDPDLNIRSEMRRDPVPNEY
jgi:hypothetical protein